MYLSYQEQEQAHISFLRSYGLDVGKLEFGKFMRCRAIGTTQGRGEYVYICNMHNMDNKDFIGLNTWCRGTSGQENHFKTYGRSENNLNRYFYPSTVPIENSNSCNKKHLLAARKAYGIWENSSSFGSSCYLEKKKVGSYGIRFKASQDAGDTAIIPMHDHDGYLWNCQMLNADGRKYMLTGSRAKGLFHKLNILKDGDPIGIAEGYVTAATCFEVSSTPMVCCFFASNMPEVAQNIRMLYPKSPIFLFTDNDKHLEMEAKSNKGLLAALQSAKIIRDSIYIIEPNFGDLRPSKDLSDWNDLVCAKGVEYVKILIQEKISSIT